MMLEVDLAALKAWVKRKAIAEEMKDIGQINALVEQVTDVAVSLGLFTAVLRKLNNNGPPSIDQTLALGVIVEQRLQEEDRKIGEDVRAKVKQRTEFGMMVALVLDAVEKVGQPKPSIVVPNTKE